MKKGTMGCISLVLLLALYVRLDYVLHAVYLPLDWDQLEYTKTAIQLLEKGIYAYRDTVPNTWVTPGWPVLLAGIFAVVGHDPIEPALMAVRVLNCFLALGSIWFLFQIGSRLFHPLTGLISAFFAAVYPPFVWSASLILTEVPFLTVFTGMLYMQVRVIQEDRRKDHIWLGLLLGICVLIRPNVLPLALVPYLFLWVKQRRVEWAQILWGAVAFSLIMMPWWVRNVLTFHHFIFIANGEAGNPFLGGTDPYFRGTIDWSRIEGKDQFAEGVKRIKQGLREDPIMWIKWMTIGKFLVFFKTMWVGPYPFSVPSWYFNLLIKMHTYILYVGWLTMAVFSYHKLSVRYLAVSLLIFLGVHMLFIPVDRYSYGMFPFFMLATAHFITSAALLVRQAFMTSLLQRKGI
jgi:4-amino-4-deoxy-L-arabinose transferase-like glycosyltransferase